MLHGRSRAYLLDASHSIEPVHPNAQAYCERLDAV